ncbi:GyrI-like domain-containing protein [bacterium]|jgi:AraC family transcriptional regulator|nr:GyrI-like domain-containing protein [bacterium]
MEPKIVTLEPIKVLSIMKLGPYEKTAHESWESIMKFAIPKGLVTKKTGTYGCSYDDPAKTAPEKIRYEACISIDKDIEVEGDFKIKTIGDGKYVVLLHEGACEEVARTYNVAFKWLADNKIDYRISPCIEKYLNYSHDIDPKDLRTELYIPIK